VDDLRVGDEEGRVRDPRLPRLLLRGRDEPIRAIHANRLALRPDVSRDQARAVAEAAADVEHARPGRIRAPGERRVAVRGEAVDQQMLEAAELVEEDGVPCLDDDIVGSSHGASL
jgi:hypothetical protein